MSRLMDDIPSGQICENCHLHPATDKWIGEQSGLDVAHGGRLDYWCRCCAIKAQLEYAQKQAGLVAELEEKLKTACQQ